jgi:phage internal scaffolding protein
MVCPECRDVGALLRELEDLEMAIEVPFVRTPYNYDRLAASDESGLKCSDPSLTVQSMTEEADINTIVRRFGLTGQVTVHDRPPLNEEFVDVMDFHSAQNLIRAAQEAFMDQPAEVRARFDNDPGKFVDFCSDGANHDELVKLGLAVAKATPEGSVAPGVAPGEAGASGAKAPA